MKQPPAGRATVQAARAAGPGLAKLRNMLAELERKLAPAGITRAQILEALAEPPATPLDIYPSSKTR